MMMSGIAMPPISTAELAVFGENSGQDMGFAAKPAGRLFSIWEITTWILPMAPEHLRRVLAKEPDLPQGEAGAEGGTRWFSAADVVRLRQYFTQGARGARYQTAPIPGGLAPLVVLAGPQGNSGRSTLALHLAQAAVLAGWRVLLIDGDPVGRLAEGRFRGETPTSSPRGVLSLIARDAARALRRMNSLRVEQGEPPLAMDEQMAAALDLTPADQVKPSLWPGLDLIAAPTMGLLADVEIAGWRMAQRSWQPWRALATALDEPDQGGRSWRQSYDLILCDTGRGLGPLALSLVASADVLLAPLPLQDGGAEGVARGLAALGAAMARAEQEAQALARALGRKAPAFGWQDLAILPTRSGGDGMARLAGFAAKPMAPARLLPEALPELPQHSQTGAPRSLYDLDYRDLGRTTYHPLRDATEAAFRGFAARVMHHPL